MLLATILCANPWPLSDLDWLVERASAFPARVHASTARSDTSQPGAIVLENGLVARTLCLTPDAATVRLTTGERRQARLRAIEPEAVLTIDGLELRVGGLVGQPNRAFLTDEWLATLAPDPRALHLVRSATVPPRAALEWKRARPHENRSWPPEGQGVELVFALAADAPADLASLRGIEVVVHYELYSGLPLFAKWIELVNGSARAIVLDAFTADRLALVEAESTVEDTAMTRLPAVDVFSDFSMHGMDLESSRRTTWWIADPAYTTQVNYSLRAPMIVESRLALGPKVTLAPGARFESFRTYELYHDSTDRERQGLALRRALRILAPWTTENPLLHHVTSSKPEAVRLAIDQCAEVGFEMVIQSFGSGFDAENVDTAYLAQQKALADYAHSKGIQLGGYSLLASRSVSPDDDVIDRASGQPGHAIFGNSPCLGSRFGDDYFAKLEQLFTTTGLDVLEHDGSYPGDTCASTTHPGHRGYEDSLWTQWVRIRDFYRWCRARGIYLNVPDYYFLSGSSKTGMGYRETNWSLPREQQVVHARQNLFDGTWTKAPSQGWMFVPLTEYHGGGAAATIEPLREHLDTYEQHLANNFLFGAQACWRGPRLYDSDETKALVKRWVELFRRHREVLEADVLHLRRADGVEPDYVLHVNPLGRERGLLAVFNPCNREVPCSIEIDGHYMGLPGVALCRERDGAPFERDLSTRAGRTFTLALSPNGASWITFEAKP